MADRKAKQLCVGLPMMTCLESLLAHRFYQTPAKAYVWIDAAACASILPNSGKSLCLDCCGCLRIIFRENRKPLFAGDA